MMGYVYPEAAFRIDGLWPKEGQDLGSFGFSIALHADFVKRCLDTKRPEGQRVNRMAGIAIARLFPPALTYGMDWSSRAINWYEDTLLLHGVAAPGNACDLTADFQAIRDIKAQRDSDGNPWTWALEYQPHNVDSIKQVYAMLAIWMTWYNMVTATLIAK